MELTHVRGRISQRVVPSPKGSGASRRVLEKARASRRDVGNLESLLTTCVHWQPLVNALKRELCASVESLIGACASTDFSSFALVVLLLLEFFEKDVVRGFHVEFINLSGTAVLDWCDDEMFRCVKDRITGGEFVAVVLSPPYFTFCRKFRGCIGADVYSLKGLRPDDKEFCQDGDVNCVPLHRGSADHPQHVHAVGFGDACISQFWVSVARDAQCGAVTRCS